LKGFIMLIKILAGLLIGAGIGAVVGYWGQCSTGTCPLTANPFRGAIYGAVLGGIIATMAAQSAGFAKGKTGTNFTENNKMLINVGSEEAFEKIVQSKGVYLLDFYAAWCSPCKKLEPVIEAVAKKYEGRATMCKVDVSQLSNRANEFRIEGTPTVVIIKDGREIERLVGIRQQQQYEQAIDKALSDSEN
jgi:thioredoxin 1